jgi:GT2 family glycosyltransferase
VSEPRISVVIPTYNRPGPLGACLAALAAQTYPRGAYDVTVVDDGGTEPLGNVVLPFGTMMALTVLRQANAGPAAARNRAAAQATGALLAFTDDDCEPEPDWLARLSARHQAAPGAAIGGRTVNVLVRDRCATASQLLVDYLYDYYEQRSRTSAGSAPRFFTSNNLAVPAALFRQLNGFDTSFALAAGEDREFCDRWQQAGRELVYESRAVVRHAHALTLPRFWRQHFDYGRGAWHFRAARRRRHADAVRLEPLSFYRDLVLYPVRAQGIVRGIPLSALLAVAQVANATGFWRERLAARSTA